MTLSSIVDVHGALPLRALGLVLLSSCLLLSGPLHAQVALPDFGDSSASVLSASDERTLGESYNTVESLLEVDELRKFAKYMSKQKDNRKRHDNALRYAK